MGKYFWRQALSLNEEQLREFDGLPRLLAQLLYNRGVARPADAEDFLDPSLTLHDPFLMTGMDRAVARVKRAIADGERIAIYGDYDVDGVTSTALLTEFLQAAGCDICHYIPHREREGYGVHIPALRHLIEDMGARLVITADCGTGSDEQRRFAQELGVDVVVTDHHQVLSPPADDWIMVNPHQPGCRYPFKNLAGVGVAFQFVRALRISGIGPVDFDETSLLDVVALGTIGDVVPLLGDNRVLTRHGIKAINATKRPGLSALITRANLKLGQVDAEGVAYALAPRLNAPGRMDEASASFRILTTRSAEDASALATELNQYNQNRQKLTVDILAAARGQVALSLDEDPQRRLLMAMGADWPAGILGLVAGRLVDEYCRPALVVSLGEGESAGSARSIMGFNVINALSHCEELLMRYGGHSHAAGFKVSNEQLVPLEEKMCALAGEMLSESDLRPELLLDAEVSLGDLGSGLYQQLKRLEPYGNGNPMPVLVARGVLPIGIRAVGAQGQHLRFKVYDSTTRVAMPAIAFRQGEWARRLAPNQPLDLAFSLSEDEWNGERSLQLNVRDFGLHLG